MFRPLALIALWGLFPVGRLAAQEPLGREEAPTSLLRGPLSLTLTPAAVSMQLAVAVPGDSLRDSDSSSQLTWYDRRGGPRLSKVTVSTLSPGQRYTLRVQALSVTNGTALGAVTLQDGQPDRDLILNIEHRREGSALLRYDVAASPADGLGVEVHVVTYTLIRQ